jgi:polyhydroxyalkanoate synthesis regulator phasin
MKKRTILIVGGASALLLLAILFGAFFAGPLLASANSSQNTSNTATNTYCTQYLQDLAQRLNVSVSTLQQDKLAARKDVINQMVKDGKLTQAQATAIEQKLSSRQECTGTGNGLAYDRFVTRQFLQKYRPVMINDIAKGLNLSSTQLTSDLKAGQSLSQIATAQRVSATQLNTIVNNAIQDALRQAVSARDLTQAQADAYTQYLQKHPQLLTQIVDKQFKARK